MKISLKIALALSILSIFTSLSIAYAQMSNITSITSPTTVNLNSVYIINNVTNTNNDLTQLNAWAVGDSGTILRWDGSQWTSVSSPTSANLYSVFFFDTSNGWAVGGTANSGVILNYANGVWSIFNNTSFTGNPTGSDPINNTLYSVTMDDTGMIGWAVGANGITLNWDANSGYWYGFPSITSNTLRSVSMVHDAVDAWAVGDAGTLFHWTGTAWVSQTSTTTAPLYTIAMVNATSGWAAGGSANSGVVINLNGTTWSLWTRFNFRTVDGVPTGNDILNSTIYSISMDTANSAWAVGSEGTVMYWTGSEWACQANVVPNDLLAVSMVHGTSNNSIQAWAVGTNGKIIAWNGSAWVPELSFMVVPLLMGIVLFAAMLRKLRLYKKF